MHRTIKLNCTSPRVSKGDTFNDSLSPPLRRGLVHLSVAIVVVVLIGFLLLPSVFAQETGGVKGKVRNMSDQGIAGATISARQKGVDLKTAKTDAKGNFLLDGLESGVYNLAFEARGYAMAVQYNVEIKKGKVRDLGGRLILLVDRGTRVIVKGSVFFKEGTSAPGAKVEVETVAADGSVRKLGETMTDYLGEFSFSQPERAAKLRFKAYYNDGKGSKDIDVDSAMIYRLSVMLDIARPGK